jgi:poly(hydroxyalkanoate) depolymerase family esterase
MRWSPHLRTLKRGLRLAARLARTGLTRPPRPIDEPLPGTFVAFDEFGPNPGKLRMLVRVPSGRVPSGDVSPDQPLVVLLHGCGQHAAAFANHTGWAAWADRLGIPLVLPEQAEANNRHRCFHWFRTSDIRRDHGEAGSIASMTRAAADRFATDPDRICIAGLSAGGAMAAMCGAYPDLFAAGAVVAGLPVGAAASGMQAVMRMANAGPDHSADAWTQQVHHSAGRSWGGKWPRLSIWQGQADTTVDPANAELLAAQWRALHDLPVTPDRDETATGARHRAWGDAVELWTLPNQSHGYPVAIHDNSDRHMITAPTPATPNIAKFWGLG